MAVCFKRIYFLQLWIFSAKSISATSTSGGKVEIVPISDLGSGSHVFTDRDYKFFKVGNYPETCSFIRGPNEDKKTDPDMIQTELEVPFPSTVYLDIWGGDEHLKKISKWADSWKEANTEPTSFGPGKATWGPGKVIKRNFDAGTIGLMGNNGGEIGGGHGTYYAFVCPQGKPTTI